YYYCPRRRHGHCPWDQTLRRKAGDLTPASEAVASLAGVLSSFAEAAEKVLPRLANLRLSESTVERTTETAGQRLGLYWASGRTLGPPVRWPRLRRLGPRGGGLAVNPLGDCPCHTFSS